MEEGKDRIGKAIKYIGMGLRQLTFSKDPRALQAIQKISEALSILGKEEVGK